MLLCLLKSSVILIGVILGGVARSWLTGGLEAIEDRLEVLHVVADEFQLLHRDVLALRERVETLLLLRCRRIWQRRRVDLRLILTTAKVLDHVDSCDNLGQFADLFPLFSTGFLLIALQGALLGLDLLIELGQLGNVVIQLHYFVFHLVLVVVHIRALLLVHLRQLHLLLHQITLR